MRFEARPELDGIDIKVHANVENRDQPFHIKISISARWCKWQACETSQFDKEIHKEQVRRFEEWYVNHVKENSLEEKQGWGSF